MSRIDSWSGAERAILKAHYMTKADREIETILLAAGYVRTAPSIKNERSRRGWKRPTKTGRPETRGGKRPPAERGWPILKGEPEERDRMFYRTVLRHAVECGAITVTRAA